MSRTQEAKMELHLKPPIFIIPQLQNEEDRERVRRMGIIIGPLARITKAEKNTVPLHLVSTPEDWGELVDEFGMYLADHLGRRRIYMPKPSVSYASRAQLLPRFAIQEWYRGGSDWRYYIRKTMGGEQNIFHYSCVFGKHQENGVPFQQEYEQDFETDSKVSARKKCEQWLSTHYPDWNNPLAYWDE